VSAYFTSNLVRYSSAAYLKYINVRVYALWNGLAGDEVYQEQAWACVGLVERARIRCDAHSCTS
jgi:hypothetical protein